MQSVKTYISLDVYALKLGRVYKHNHSDVCMCMYIYMYIHLIYKAETLVWVWKVRTKKSSFFLL